jgi:hypothetical protein
MPETDRNQSSDIRPSFVTAAAAAAIGKNSHRPPVRERVGMEVSCLVFVRARVPPVLRTIVGKPPVERGLSHPFQL